MGTGETVRAAVFDGTGSFEIREFPVPDPPPGGGVLAVEAVGMCGSDLMQLHGVLHIPGQVSPVVPGHEIVGRIATLTPEARATGGSPRAIGSASTRLCGADTVPGACGGPTVDSSRCTATRRGLTTTVDSGVGAHTMSGATVSLDALEHGLALLERRVADEDTTHVSLVHGGTMGG